ncbi:m-AAA protease-interacting protein 1, mitochondrial [Calliopsis andreniformis]|uniref:m-AAA protease-interacting protein 1, mitochondrial n=1 Tax=Calliopsis andreniformis TaxID=337506 RepID=UPI003FCDCB68
MLALIFRKYILRAPIRRFSTAIINNRDPVKRNAIYYWTDTKCNKCVNHVTIYKRFNSTSKEADHLPPLMGSDNISQFSFIYCFGWIWTIPYILIAVDPDFRPFEHLTGAKHAMIIISDALAAQNYEALEGLVAEKTLEILKKNVSSLTESQRTLIAMSKGLLIKTVPTSIDIESKNTDNDNETIIAISYIADYISGTSFDNTKPLAELFLPDQENSFVRCTYKFERKYKNGKGDSWIATVVNHYTL